MRIVLDLQAAQSESRLRGIGRYSLSLAKALIRNSGQHDIYVSLNHVFSGTIEPLRAEFRELLPEQNILVYRTLPVALSRDPSNQWRNAAGQLIRESFLASLQADIVHTCSMFEGWEDDSVVSCGRLSRDYISAVTLYDLIPYTQPEKYLPTPKHQSWYMDQLESLQQNDILLAISDYSRRTAIESLGVSEEKITTIFADADPLFCSPGASSLNSAKLRRLGIHSQFIMYTGVISRNDPRKNCPGLLQAYARLSPELRRQYQLVLVGRYNAYDHRDLNNEAAQLGIEAGQLVFTDRVSDLDLVLLYGACRLFVFPSLEEGFGLPALEAMRCGAVVIGSNNSSIPEVIANPEAMFDPHSSDDMARAMERALVDEALRDAILASSAEQAATFSWDRSASLAMAAFERAYEQRCRSNDSRPATVINAGADTARQLNPELLPALAKIAQQSAQQQDLVYCAQAIAENHPARATPKLYLDISILIRVDAMTGIQRVVRSLLQELTTTAIDGVEVEPIYRDDHGNFRVAEAFGVYSVRYRRSADDPLIDVIPGDIYLGLDLDLDGMLVDARNDFLRYQRQRGLRVFYIVYDLLPIFQSQHFDSNIRQRHPQWLQYIASEADGLICISEAVTQELATWLEVNPPKRCLPLKLDSFHLGADIESSMPTQGLAENAIQLFQSLREHPSILMVGTIEPRKGQQQALDAMELVWAENDEVNLVLVGKSGWGMEQFEKRLDQHPQRDKRLFWLPGISDEMLQQVYAASSLLLSASTGEGFGLPLIEAAQHELPILARDIPVFREVAGDHALYFSGNKAGDLADAIRQWQRLHGQGEVPPSTGMNWLSWKQSAEQLKTLLLEQREWSMTYSRLMPPVQ